MRGASSNGRSYRDILAMASSHSLAFGRRKNLLQIARREILRPLGITDNRCHAEELVSHALVALMSRLYASFLQPLGQHHAVGEKRIDLRVDDGRRGAMLETG